MDDFTDLAKALDSITAPAPKPTGSTHGSPHGPDDKTKLQYDIFINKTEKHIMVLQFPNRDRKQPYNMRAGQKPLELRIKPISGLVEVDVPIVVEQCYDQHKGIKYGQALKKSRVLRQGGSYGLAGGLGVNGPVRGPRDDLRNAMEEISEEKLLENFEDSNNKGHVLNKITLGGRIVKPENGKPNYFIGVFKGKSLHLTRVSAFCSLTPQFHHLDAMTDNDRAFIRATRDAENPAPESEARVVNMAVKSTDSEELDMGQISKQLREIEEEPWQRLEWIDEDDIRSVQTYNGQLVLNKESQGTTLVSAMTKQQYLDAVSAPRVDPTNQGKKVKIGTTHIDESSDAASEEEKPVKKGKGKAKDIKGKGKAKADDEGTAEEEGNGEGFDQDAEEEAG
ncbi:hypothetical protein MMC30_007078 [Trapelia coarctata]|nr:hypothetical protein [Trapelia coarctata]